MARGAGGRILHQRYHAAGLRWPFRDQSRPTGGVVASRHGMSRRGQTRHSRSTHRRRPSSCGRSMSDSRPDKRAPHRGRKTGGRRGLTRVVNSGAGGGRGRVDPGRAPESGRRTREKEPGVDTRSIGESAPVRFSPGTAGRGRRVKSLAARRIHDSQGSP